MLGSKKKKNAGVMLMSQKHPLHAQLSLPLTSPAKFGVKELIH